MTDITRRKRTGEAWETVAEGASGSQSQSVTVTTDPDTFTVTTFLDLSSPTVASVVVTVTAEDADGETFGEGDEEISGTLFIHTSSDGVTPDATNANLGPTQLVVGQLVDVDDTSGAVVRMTSRYVQVQLDIDQAPDFNIYAGSNHPTMTIRIDAAYG